MICPDCRGRGFTPLRDSIVAPCESCMGSGIASCCDASGSRDAERVKLDPYRDPQFPPRACDYCTRVYQGPAVYCSFECAVDDL